MPFRGSAEPDVRRGLGVAVAGTLVIASTYGMARFGVGLFAATLVEERPALGAVIGWAAGAQFASYSVAALVAVHLADRRPRVGLLLAGATATAGCLGVAVAASPAGFVLAVFVGGMGAGFASPALVRVIDAVVARRARASAQSLVNTGTAVGVVATGSLALLASAPTPAWTVMAAANAAAVGGVLVLVRRCRDLSPSTGSGGRPLAASDLRALLVPACAAGVTGVGSALIWTYGPLLAIRSGSLDASRVGLLWIALGLGGVVGPLTGVVVDRRGTAGAWRLSAQVLVLANLALAAALALDLGWSTYVAMVLFGAGYMCLSGVLILWAGRVVPAAGAGTSVLFVALAVGQAIGAVGFQSWLDSGSPVTACVAAAVLCVLGGAIVQRPR